MKEKEIDQKLLEQEQSGPDSAYGFVMRSLEEEPGSLQSYTLADGVLHKLVKKKQRSGSNYWLIMALIATVFLALGFGSMVLFMGWETFSEIKGLSVYGILIGLMVVAIQYLDEKLLKRDLKFS